MKVAIVTGATRGIGRQIAIDLAQEGYNVVINYNSNEAKALEVKALCDEFNEAIIVKGNVSEANECQAIIDAAMQKFGRINLLVNNAGITLDNLVLRMTEEDFQKVVQTNLNGTFYMCKYASKIMFKQKSGKIINMASVIGEVGNIGQANYSASKGGVIAMSKSLTVFTLLIPTLEPKLIGLIINGNPILLEIVFIISSLFRLYSLALILTQSRIGSPAFLSTSLKTALFIPTAAERISQLM